MSPLNIYPLIGLTSSTLSIQITVKSYGKVSHVQHTWPTAPENTKIPLSLQLLFLQNPKIPSPLTSWPKLLKNTFFFFLVFGPNVTLVMFIWKIDSFKIVFVKDTFKYKNRLCERHFLTKFFKIRLKSVFTKDNFWPNLSKLFFVNTTFD